MKKIFSTVAGTLVIGLCALQAQDPNTDGSASQSENRSRDRQQYEQPKQKRDRTRMHRDRDQAWQQQGDQRGNAYANEGMVIIDKNEMPSSLKDKLQDEKYAGWENGTVYHNTNTGEYVIAPRAFRFDDKGNEIESDYSDAGNRDYNNRSGRRGRYSSGQGNDAASQNRNGTTGSQNSNSPERSSETEMNDQSQPGQQSTQQPSSGYRAGDDAQDNETRDQSGQTQPDQTQSGQSQSGQDQSGQSQNGSTQRINDN